ncbi:hypothetical protein [Thermococcus waiotapuensis]|uniref:Uncharacterized protein n=1 Tax=Thermococcus waiotapuensis TaxID=90909 RepID=A0AAE4NU57_9EURY|nr:hypothetical protein [Thermococcus waiotapuensis]MDV3103919.1 hypothetical protein [Thermococcus waiotapuensis]
MPGRLFARVERFDVYRYHYVPLAIKEGGKEKRKPKGRLWQ